MHQQVSLDVDVIKQRERITKSLLVLTVAPYWF